MRTAVQMLASRHFYAPQHKLPAASAAAAGHSARTFRSSSSLPQSAQLQQQQTSSGIHEADMRAVAAWRLALLQQRSTQHVQMSLALLLRGVSFHNRQDFIQQLQPGQGVVFCKEPSNAADPHAVAVHTAGMQQLGYIPREAAQHWQLETCFGRVVGIGKAGGAGPWGASVSCMPWIQGLCLDLLLSSWQDAADLEKILGQQQWAAVQQRVLQQSGNRCAISSMPADKSPWPLRVVTQWQFDYITKQVQLAQLVPVCEPLYQLTQQLAVIADKLAHLSPSLQLPTQAEVDAAEHRITGTSLSAASSSSSSISTTAEQQQQQQQQHATMSLHEQESLQEDCSLHGQAVALHAAQADAAAAAVAGLTAEQQDALRWLGVYLRWPQVDCVKYVAYAGWRRQQLLLQDGWQLMQPDAASVQMLVPETL